MTKLNIGCGTTHITGFINIDNDEKVKPDKLMDLNKLPYEFEDNSVDFIYADQVLEHLQVSFIDLFKEFYRILKKGGTMFIAYPNMFFWRNRIAYLLGEIEWKSDWHCYHTKLIKPTTIISLLKMQNFKVKIIRQNKGLTNSLFLNNVNLTETPVLLYARKRGSGARKGLNVTKAMNLFKSVNENKGDNNE